jgi:ABC-type multidrug transport system ATPase subunit
MEEVISAQNISKSYRDIKAVDSLSFSVKKGDFFGFLGPNGAGKTTTIRMLTGVLKPDEGTILVNNHDVRDKRLVSKAIGVLSESRGFYDWMNAEEYLSFFADLYGIANKRETISSLLEQVGLTERRQSAIGTYSRGMKQRLGLARSLINNPEILFLDEPTLGLDPQGQEDVQQLLTRLNKNGVTVFYSSHLLHEVSQLCSVITVINEGRFVASGTLGELQEQTRSKDLKDIFLTLTHTKNG